MGHIQYIHQTLPIFSQFVKALHYSSAALFHKSSSINKPSTEVLVAPKSQSLVLGQSRWDLVVGLEVHAQLSTHSKLFSSARCPADFGRHTFARVNSLVAPFDAAFPGTMPVSNF